MIGYPSTRVYEALESIVSSSELLPGRNVSDGLPYVHFSKRFPDWVTIDVSGPPRPRPDLRAWIVKFEIPDSTPLLPDPSGEDKYYCGEGMWGGP